MKTCRIQPVVVCGICAGRSDVDLYTDNPSSTQPKCPYCNQYVSQRREIKPNFPVPHREYVLLRTLYNDLVHRIVHGLWCNMKVRFEVSYPLISNRSVSRAYHTLNEDELHAIVDEYLTEWEQEILPLHLSVDT